MMLSEKYKKFITAQNIAILICVLFAVILFSSGDENNKNPEKKSQEASLINQMADSSQPGDSAEKDVKETEENKQTSGAMDEAEDISQEKETDVRYYKIAKVVDGDTIAVEMDGKNETIRLIGINTPETVDPRTTVECFGKEASDKAKEVLNNKNVRLEFDSGQGERDKYERLLRYAFLENGTNFGKLMISEGFAYEYTYNTPYKYQDEFKQAEKEARDNKRGLWADNTCAGKLTKPVSQQTTPAETPTSAPLVPQSASTPSAQSSCDCSSNKYNCTDFKTHSEAQNIFDCCKNKTGADIHRLDNDSDGLACESLP